MIPNIAADHAKKNHGERNTTCSVREWRYGSPDAGSIRLFAGGGLSGKPHTRTAHLFMYASVQQSLAWRRILAQTIHEFLTSSASEHRANAVKDYLVVVFVEYFRYRTFDS